MCLWRGRGDDGCRSAVVVFLHKWSCVVSCFGTSTTIPRSRGLIEFVASPPPIKIAMMTAMGAKFVKGMHPPGKMVVSMLMQPVYMSLLLVA